MRSEEFGEGDDGEDGLKHRYRMDLFCGLFLQPTNRGFCISPEVSGMLAERGLEIGFDLYFEEAGQSPRTP